jgi:DNA-binding HxlR family transcriptional regulator
MTRSAISASDQRAIHATLVSSRQVTDLICDRWSLSIILALIEGERRFSDLAARSGIASRLLNARLTTLTEIGVILRMPYSMHPPRFEYHLTNMGQELLPAFLQMDRWEQGWCRAPRGSTRFTHLTCGASLHTALCCRACGQVASARDIELKVSRAQLEKVPEKQARHRRSILDSESHVGPPQLLGPSLDVFGDKWSAEILTLAFFGLHRFNDFRERLGISANILSDRLERLAAAEVLSRGRDPGRPSGYWLTPRGVDLYGAVVALHEWADKWVRGRYKSPVRLLHRDCGEVFWPALICAACQAVVRTAEVGFVTSP